MYYTYCIITYSKGVLDFLYVCGNITLHIAVFVCLCVFLSGHGFKLVVRVVVEEFNGSRRLRMNETSSL